MYEIYKDKGQALLSTFTTGLLYLVRPQFRELAQLVSNQVGQALSYFWTLLFLEAGYLMLVFSLVKKYSPRTVFQWAKKKQFLPAIYATIFSSCAIYWLATFLVGSPKDV